MSWASDKKIRQWIPKLQAHRGYWVGGLAQNSLSSIAEAEKKGYEMVEFDVRLTADQQVVLFHDESFQNHFLEKISLNKLRSLLEVNTLEEVLIWFSHLHKQKNTKFKLNIELKSKYVFDFTLERKVSALLRKYNLSDTILISSFNPFALTRFRLYSPHIYRALIQTLEDYPLNKWFIRKRIFNFLAGPHAWHLRYQDWDMDKFKSISKKVPVILWTVNDFNYYSEVKDQVAGVISDEITPNQI